MDGEDGTGNVIEGSWRDDDETYCLEPLSHIGSNRQVVYTNVAAMIEILSLGIRDLLLKCETCTRTILIVQQERCAGKKHMCSEQINNNYYLHETIIARVRGGKRFRGKFSVYQDLVNPELGHCLLPWSEPPQRGSHLMAKMALLIQLFFFLPPFLQGVQTLYQELIHGRSLSFFNSWRLCTLTTLGKVGGGREGRRRQRARGRSKC